MYLQKWPKIIYFIGEKIAFIIKMNNNVKDNSIYKVNS